MKDEIQERQENAATEKKTCSAEAFEGYALVFGLMGKLLYANPEYEWLSDIAAQQVFDELPLSCVNEDILEGQKLLRRWFGEGGSALSYEAVEEVKCEYVPLFLNGKNGAAAPPWESIYVNHSPAFFQCSTMSVRMWYKRYSLEAENQEHEPDDHIGLELTFLSYLCAIAAGLVEPPMVDGEAYPVNIVCIDASEFASTHLFNWATHWCDIVSGRAKTDFYRGVALFTKGTLACFAMNMGKEIKPKVYR